MVQGALRFSSSQGCECGSDTFRRLACHKQHATRLSGGKWHELSKQRRQQLELTGTKHDTLCSRELERHQRR